MPIFSPIENRQLIDNQTSSSLEYSLDYCNEKVQEAMRSRKTMVCVWTGIEYGNFSQQYALESKLVSAGYRIDSEMSVRHGLIIDIIWDK